ncbi:MAG: hypothetical protein O2954_11225 [bacterium]|nr:hypothetical protein [bacterium]
MTNPITIGCLTFQILDDKDRLKRLRGRFARGEFQLRDRIHWLEGAIVVKELVLRALRTQEPPL